MKRFLATLMISLVLVGSLPAEEASNPGDVVDEFFKLMNDKRVNDANALFVTFPKIPRKKIRETLQNDAAQNRYRGFKVADYQQQEEAAVVLVVMDASNAMPIYLVHRNKQWRLLPGLNDYGDSRFALSRQQKKTFKELKRWFNEREKMFTQ